MQISMIRAKLHHARVTNADVLYEGSIGIDTDLMQQAGIYPYERVLVVDVENGARLETYTIPTPAGSREVSLNGAAARLVSVGDRIIIMAFASIEAPPPANWEPHVLILDDNNEVSSEKGNIIT